LRYGNSFLDSILTISGLPSARIAAYYVFGKRIRWIALKEEDDVRMNKIWNETGCYFPSQMVRSADWDGVEIISNTYTPQLLH
jgi:hypothetical protein